MTASSSDPVARLKMVEAEALICTKCPLAEGRTQVVFGAGDPQADVLFVGEAPGQREDEQGLPFVGPSGRLLEELLAEIDLTRDAVYIANVVKCRPPKNRDPRPDEIDTCKGYLRTQLELIDPAVVVTLGNFSTKLLLRTEVGITRLRGTAYEWWGRYLVPTFHPAAALRGRAQVLEDLRYDFSLVRDVLDGNLATDTDTDTEEETPPPPRADDPRQLGLFGQ
ncbi:MAG: uracil-DNA glycosylase [Acidimicrobiia bacterium]|nr:MAG: uracil-DNA glycosylase [Acidimicrobiia bacterium]